MFVKQKDSSGFHLFMVTLCDVQSCQFHFMVCALVHGFFLYSDDVQMQFYLFQELVRSTVSQVIIFPIFNMPKAMKAMKAMKKAKKAAAPAPAMKAMKRLV